MITMKKLLVLAVAMTAGTAISYGTACNVGSLYSADAPSCTETLTNVDGSGASVTLTFTSLVNTGTDAADIFANLDSNSAIGLAGFTWTDTNGSFSQVGSTSLGFTATITGCSAGFACAITGYDDQVLIPSGSAADADSATGVSNYNLNIGSQTALQLGTVNLQTATKLSTYNGLATQISDESDVQVSAVSTSVPEPATLGLVGLALLGAGVMQRRRSARK
jgi:hypothetical protein